MKIGTLILGLIVGSASMWAQTNTPQTSTQGGTQSKPSGTMGSMQSPMMHDQHGAQMGGMQQQQMKQSVAEMKALLEQMKTNAASMTGKDKAAWDANVQLWQKMIDHMDQMTSHMSEMGGMGMGSGSGMMMHKHGPGGANRPPQPQTPAKPQQ